jgi:predicted heme/steroid binding protein
MKKWLLIVTLVLTIGLAGCQSENDVNTDKVTDDNQQNDVIEDDQNEVIENDVLQLTEEELSVYNGQDGEKAYVAVNGIIYDVTNVSAWRNGSHNGATAGQDVSDFINNAPHGESVLDDLEVVGELID